MDTRTQQSPFLLVIALAIICVVANISTLSATPAAAQSATETGGVLLTSPTLNVQIPGLRFASGLIAKPGEKTEIPYLAQYVRAYTISWDQRHRRVGDDRVRRIQIHRFFITDRCSKRKEIIKDATWTSARSNVYLAPNAESATDELKREILQVSKEEFKAGTSAMAQKNSATRFHRKRLDVHSCFKGRLC